MEDTERVVADNSGSSGALQACMLNKQCVCVGGGTSGACPGARRVILAAPAGLPLPHALPWLPKAPSQEAQGAGPHQAISIQDRLF